MKKFIAKFTPDDKSEPFFHNIEVMNTEEANQTFHQLSSTWKGVFSVITEIPETENFEVVYQLCPNCDSFVEFEGDNCPICSKPTNPSCLSI